MSTGLTEQGFVKKELSEIKTDIETSLKIAFGDSIDLSGDSVFGQLVGVFAERESQLWDLAEGVNNSQYPDTASGASLDSVARIVNVTRLAASFSTGVLRISGDAGTVIPAGFAVAVQDRESDIFETIESGTIGTTGLNELQLISFSEVPTAGKFNLSFGNENTIDIVFSDGAAQVQAALRAVTDLDDVLVTGSYVAGFTIEFAGSLEEENVALVEVIGNTLSGASGVSTTVTETQQGTGPFVDVSMRAQNVGPIVALAGTVNDPISAVSGVDSVTNLEDVEVGSNRESDGDLRLRQSTAQIAAGKPTLEGLRQALLAVEDVEEVLVIENVEITTDSDGRPPKSFESFVLGGLDTQIRAAIFSAKPAGIQSFGQISGTVVDSQGITQPVNFSRPTSIEIYMIVNIVVNSDSLEGPTYPLNGDTQVRDALLAYGETLPIGRDVSNSRLYTPINTVPGVSGIEVLLGTAPAPSTAADVIIGVTERAEFDSARIIINS